MQIETATTIRSKKPTKANAGAESTTSAAPSSVFLFDDPIEFLNAQFAERQRRNPLFSLRAWASSIGYRHPSMLFYVLRGERSLKMDLAVKLAASLNLKGNSLRYFELLVLKKNSKNEEERRVFEANLGKLRPRHLVSTRSISLELFSLVGDWHHFAILALLDLPDFSVEPTWLQSRLGADLDKRVLRAAVERLKRLGLLVQDEDGAYRKADPAKNHLMIENQIPSEAIRRYHSQMIEKSRAAVEQQTVDERHLEATTIKFHKRHLAKAVRIMHEAHLELMKLSDGCDDANELYQINSQIFRLSRKAKENLV